MSVSEFQRHEVFKWEMQAGFAELRAEMHAGFAEMQAAHSGLLVKLFFGTVASNATLVGLVLASTQLG